MGEKLILTCRRAGKELLLKKNAFTLIELLVVIAIIDILAAILFPVFAKAKMAAKKTADLSNMKQIGIGVMMYNTDHDDTYPMGYWYKNDLGEVNGYVDFSVLIMPYMKSEEMWVGPADPNRGLIPRWPVCTDKGNFSAADPPCDNQVPRKSYTANAALIPRKRRSIDPANVVLASGVDQVADTIVIAPFNEFKSCVFDSSFQQNNDVVNKSHRPTNAVMTQTGGKWAGEKEEEYQIPIYAVTMQTAMNAFEVCKLEESGSLPHIKYINHDQFDNGSNYAFADGHAKFFNFAATINPESFKWGKSMYSARGASILDQSGKPVR